MRRVGLLVSLVGCGGPQVGPLDNAVPESGHPLPDGVSFESLHAPYRTGLTEAETVTDICAGH